MNSNSIYGILNTDSVINEIRLSLSVNPNAPFIIVEGDDDIDFFRHHCPESVKIRESFGGKHGVCEIINMFDDRKSIIGICDRDYDYAQFPIHVYFYDYSCLETMVFSNSRTTDILFTELGLKESVSLETILRQLVFLSYLRKINFTDGLFIRFDGLRIAKLLDPDLKLTNSAVLRELQRINSSDSVLDDEQNRRVEEKASLSHTLDELLCLTQGHDLIAFVQCCHVRHSSKKGKTKSDKDIRSLLYCAYADKFVSSKLYADVLRYGVDTDIAFWKIKID